MTTTRDKILKAGLDIAEREGLSNVRRDDVAQLAQVAPASVNWHFRNVTMLRDQILRAAIQQQRLRVVAHALIDEHPIAVNAPRDIKRAAKRLIVAE